MEAEAAPWWSRFADWWSWLRLRFAEMQSGETQTPLTWIAVAAALVLWVGWRLFGKPAQTVAKPAQHAAHETAPGSDSPFYRIEQALGARGWQRSAHETLQEWVARIAPHLGESAAELTRLLPLHYRWRFDPQGLSDAERSALNTGVDAWLAQQPA